MSSVGMLEIMDSTDVSKCQRRFYIDHPSIVPMTLVVDFYLPLSHVEGLIRYLTRGISKK